MMQKSDLDLSTPQLQSKIAILVSISGFAKGLIKQFWILIPLIFLGRGGVRTEVAFLGLFIFFGLFSLVLSIVGYFRFYFYLKDDELIIQKGIFRKLSLSLPLERIQSVNFNQGPVHQLFNVVSVEIDSAGSDNKELTLDAIDKAKAIEIREILMARRESIVSDSGEKEISEEVTTDLNEGTYSERFRLNFKDLLKVGVSENHLQTAGIIMAFFFTMYESFTDFLFEDLIYYIEKAMGLDLNSTLYTALIIVPVLLIVSFFITLFRTVLKEYNLRFYKGDKGYKIESGLINRRESSSLFSKLQIFSFSCNPLQRIFKMFAVRLNQASSSEMSAKKSIRVPGVYADQLNQIVNDIYGLEWYEQKEEIRPSQWLGIRRVLFLAVLPGIFVFAGAILLEEYKYLLFPLLAPFIGLVQWQYYKRFECLISKSILRVKSGYIVRRESVIELYKIQSVHLLTSPFLRRKGLASLRIHTASGSLGIPYISLEKAEEIYDTLLYRVELSKEHWM